MSDKRAPGGPEQPQLFIKVLYMEPTRSYEDITASAKIGKSRVVKDTSIKDTKATDLTSFAELIIERIFNSI